MKNCSTQGFALSGNQRIFFRHFGASGGIPIVVVHGLSYFSYDWTEIASSLADQGEVVAIDLRGFGDSDWSEAKDYSIESNAKDLIAVLDHFGWSKAILMGHSMGGRHCTYCAAENPDRISGLIAVDFAPEIAPQGAARVAETIGKTPDVFPSLEEASEYLRADPHSPIGEQARARLKQYLMPVAGGYRIKRDPYFRDQFRKILETGTRPKPSVDMWKALSRVVCPSLFVRGKRSDMFTPEIALKVSEAAGTAKIVELDATHNVGGEVPDQLIGVIRSFIYSLKGS